MSNKTNTEITDTLVIGTSERGPEHPIYHMADSDPLSPNYNFNYTILPDAMISVIKAMEVVKEAFIKDQSPGGWYDSCKNNLVAVIMDNSTIDNENANMIAKKFLDQFCAR